MGTVTGVMLALIATKKQGNVTVSLSYSVCFIQLSLWLLRYLHWILILKYNIMGHAPHYHIKSRLRVLTLISKNGQAQLPCSLERNLLLIKLINNTWAWGRCLERWWGLDHRSRARRVTMTTLWAATTRHRHTDKRQWNHDTYHILTGKGGGKGGE